MTFRNRIIKGMAWTMAATIGFAGELGRAAEPQPRQTVTVLRVNNGQEVLVEMNGTGLSVRLSCLQAPRPSQQPWAQQATEALQQQLPKGSELIFEFRARDVYGRHVGRLLQRRTDAGPGEDVAERLLRDGKVFNDDGYLGRCDDLPYSRWEIEARKKRLGVWNQPGGLARPWDVRDRMGDNPPPP